MSSIRVSAISHESAPGGGLVFTPDGNVSGAGLDLIVSQSFSAVSSVSVDDCFSSDYENYLVLLRLTATVAQTFHCRLRVAGVDVATGYTNRIIQNDGGVGAIAISTSSFNHTIAPASGAGAWSFYRPFVVAPTQWTAKFVGNGGGTWASDGGSVHDTSASYDGFSVIAQVGTLSGEFRIYGYRD